MARKSKRMALYEAIRQGQVNIAKGLESGKLRSDTVPQEPPKPHVSDNTALFRSKKKPIGITVPFKIWAIAAGIVGFLLLLLVIGLIVRSGDETAVPDENPPVSQTQTEIVAEKTEQSRQPEEEGSGFLGFGRNKTPQPKVKRSTPTSPASTGDNVIVIQGISASRKGELDVLKDYFAQNGVLTETIIDRSGYALLITQQGFEKNPENSGTDGYKLLQKVQQLGRQYPEVTGDTKFGLKPFQDAYGYKR